MDEKDYIQIVPVPESDSINDGISPAHQATMLNLLGKPGELTRECSEVTNEALRLSIQTANVGPFSVTGHVQAIVMLKSIFLNVMNNEKVLYDLLGTEGMLCVRAVRNSNTIYSNHSWGTAIDIRVGQLDQYGSKNCHQGLVSLYPYFHEAGWYWGAGFPTTDSMHFELSNEKIVELFGSQSDSIA